MASWRVLGASVEGALHAEHHRGCEDAHGWSIGDRVTVLAVADGAGSRPATSALGAHTAVATSLAAAHDLASAEMLEADAHAVTLRVIERVLRALEDEAQASALELGQLATTLCVALLCDGRATVAQIGDGVAVVERADERIEAVALADQFEYANEAVFVTADDALEHLKVFTADDVRSVALSTDGLRYKILEDLRAGAPFQPFFRDSWSYARSDSGVSAGLAAFLRDVDDQTGDDKTLVLAVDAFAGEPGETYRLTDRPASKGDAEVNAEETST
jgi:hypothetical protein